MRLSGCAASARWDRVGPRSEEHTSELQSLPTRRSSDLSLAAASKRAPAARRPFEREAVASVRGEETAEPTSDKNGCRPYSARPRVSIPPPVPCGFPVAPQAPAGIGLGLDRKSTRLNSSHSLHDALPISP